MKDVSAEQLEDARPIRSPPSWSPSLFASSERNVGSAQPWTSLSLRASRSLASNFDAPFSFYHHNHNNTGAGTMEPPIAPPVTPKAADDPDQMELVLEEQTQQVNRQATTMVGKLRTYPELRIKQSMTPEQVGDPGDSQRLRARADM